VHEPRLEEITLDGRSAIFFSSEDLTAGLAGLTHWGIFGYAPESATRLVANGVLHAAGITAEPGEGETTEAGDGAEEDTPDKATETARAEAE
jgi:hypothetical protein